MSKPGQGTFCSIFLNTPSASSVIQAPPALSSKFCGGSPLAVADSEPPRQESYSATPPPPHPSRPLTPQPLTTAVGSVSFYCDSPVLILVKRSHLAVVRFCMHGAR